MFAFVGNEGAPSEDSYRFSPAGITERENKVIKQVLMSMPATASYIDALEKISESGGLA